LSVFAVTIVPVKTLSRTDPMQTGLHGGTAAVFDCNTIYQIQLNI
jgi:hypothetical protein